MHRGDAGVLGVIAAGCEGADKVPVHAGPGGGIGDLFLDGLLRDEWGKAGWMRAIRGSGGGRPF